MVILTTDTTEKMIIRQLIKCTADSLEDCKVYSYLIFGVQLIFLMELVDYYSTFWYIHPVVSSGIQYASFVTYNVPQH